MMKIALVMAVTLISFLAMILMLASKPRNAGKITRTFIVLAGIGGIFFYGYGFAATTDDFWLAAIRALLAVCGMYVGKMDLSSISAAPLMHHSQMQLLFWIVHLLALYATASAAITTVGAEAMRKLRLWLVRRGALHLIYGVSDDTLDLGRQILGQKQLPLPPPPKYPFSRSLPSPLGCGFFPSIYKFKSLSFLASEPNIRVILRDMHY